jgi:hypothetical protein
MVDKNVFILTVHINKPKTFVLVEPLYASFCHGLIPPLKLFLKLGYDMPKKKASKIKPPMPVLIELFTNFDRHSHRTGQQRISYKEDNSFIKISQAFLFPFDSYLNQLIF